MSADDWATVLMLAGGVALVTVVFVAVRLMSAAEQAADRIRAASGSSRVLPESRRPGSDAPLRFHDRGSSGKGRRDDEA